MLLTLTVLAACGVVLCAVFLGQLAFGRAWGVDRGIAWFLAVNAASDLATGLVVLGVLTGALRGPAGGYALAAALGLQGAFYLWRVWLGRTLRARRGGVRLFSRSKRSKA